MPHCGDAARVESDAVAAAADYGQRRAELPALLTPSPSPRRLGPPPGDGA
eukprot:gene7770-9169_t